MGLQRNPDIIFDEAAHTYKNRKTGMFYTPVSSVLNSVIVPFDQQGTAERKATREILESMGLKEKPVHDHAQMMIFEEAVRNRKKDLIKSWEAIGQESIEFGNWVDDNLSAPIEGKKADPRFQRINQSISEEHRFYSDEKSQFILANDKWLICGTSDRVSLRPSRDPQVIDIYDYKTGLNKGITYEPGYWKDGKRFFKKDFMLPPFQYLENCTYSRYTLQLSAYGVLAESMLGARIGRLAIIYVHQNEDGTLWHEVIPVTYHRTDIIELFNRVHDTKAMLGKSPFRA